MDISFFFPISAYLFDKNQSYVQISYKFIMHAIILLLTYSCVRFGYISRLGTEVNPTPAQLNMEIESSSTCLVQEQPLMAHRAGSSAAPAAAGVMRNSRRLHTPAKILMLSAVGW